LAYGVPKESGLELYFKYIVDWKIYY